MATLSFQCPKCSKIHDRIKPEMAGFKVRCQCGFVFRLGPKSAKNKQAFQEKVRPSSKQKRKSSKASALNNKDKLLKAEPVEMFGDEMLDLIPEGPVLEAELELPVHDTPIEPQSKMVEDPDPAPVAEIDPIPIPVAEQQDPFIELLPSPLPVASPTKTRWQQPPTDAISTGKVIRGRGIRRATPSHSLAGPIWTIVLSTFGALIMLANIRLVFFEAIMRQLDAMNVDRSASVVLGTALTSITILVAIALTIFLIISGIVAIMELASRSHRGWAIRWAGFIAFGMLGCLLLMFLNVSANIIYARQMVESQGGSVDNSRVVAAITATAAVMLFSGLVPMATAITGIARNLKRKY